MEKRSADVESVTIDEIMDLATWNRQRSSEELQSFILTRHNQLPDSIEIE